MREILIKPEPFLHQLEHVTALHLRVVLSDCLLQLEEEALAAEATHTRLTMPGRKSGEWRLAFTRQ